MRRYHRHTNGHGLSGTPEHGAWYQMWERCTNKNHRFYSLYGGRGISVCKQWESVEKFIDNMGLRPSSRHQLDRIDNDGDYCPENCRWATSKEQCNNRRNNVEICINGVTKTVAQWAEAKGISQQTIHSRLRRGWEPRRAVTTPVSQKHSEARAKRTAASK